MGIYSFMKTSNVKYLVPAAVEHQITEGTRTLLDVRTDVEFAEQHVPGSEHIPLNKLDLECSRLDPSSPLALLCLGGKRATKAAEILSEKGFQDLTVIEGGLTAWDEAGLTLEKSSRSALPLMRQVQLVIGLLTLTGSLLAIFFHPLFAILPAFLGAGLTLAGSTGWCGLAILLSKMPWNRCDSSHTSCCNA